MQEYQVTLKDKRIVWGKAIDMGSLIGKYPGDSIRQGVNEALDWNLPAGVYRAKEVVMELDKMLEAILIQLGEPMNGDPTVLLDSLQANLAISGRLSSLPLGPLALEDKAGAEITAQAVRIGERLVSWAREINSEKNALAKYGPETLGKLEFRSHCYGHPLIPEAIAQVWGPYGGPKIMQIYNEYLHQFVLLRDALLPFANWEEVPFEVKEHAGFKGLRFLEPAREIFLTQLLGKRLTHKSIIRYAQSVVSSGLTDAGYGPNRNDNADAALAKRNSVSWHLAADILAHSGLVTNIDGIHFIPSGGNELVLWALLGKLYPENVVLLDKGDKEELEAAYVSGKGFGTQFLVL
ncbi:hypothetical protein [Paenibacillus sp. 32352]|uniref:hypothetical protein n=1 Tax=Paenibacillus sp. 32352 TaxID=1969111 RepID=UPI0009ADD9E5|nr:hypothetical protein [Paenibacillus sp. 32352]